MTVDEQHIALPKLYGAPAYARPAPVAIPVAPRPFDPDELPIEAAMSEDERRFAASLPSHAYAAGGSFLGRDPSGHGHGPAIRSRPFSLRAIAGRFLGND